MPRSISNCDHTVICLSSSPHVALTGFTRQSQRQRLAAIKADNRSFPREDKLFLEEDTRAFPAPLLLPGDDLAGDPEDPQSFQQWLNGEHRNPVTAKQKTVYVVPSPQVDPNVDFMRSWATPQCLNHKISTKSPSTKDVQDYLTAFYHGLPVKLMPPSTFQFIPWEEPKRRPRKKTGQQYLGLKSGHECVRIRSRTLSNGVYGGQVYLDDLLDAAISILPKDAYALLMLVDFDLYEDDEDEFVCGRAYGGSRVAVVSTARYNPILDSIQDVERVHAWPASHCGKYMSASATAEPSAKRQKRSPVNSRGSRNSTSELNGPVKNAVSVYHSLPEVDSSPSLLSALWLGRVCRTASHELGHCFGIAHCVYYACSMQGTASISEDARQPPYLCPIDLAKILCATSTSASQRYRALLAFCERPSNSDTHFFEPFATWIRSRLGQVEDLA
ncbi:Peptidase M54 archaemetzincin [Penicillium cf. griseofulvum]|uniref:Peptidase M54 archaemetzincin n=1 Tax=Penicillium cf. griseofulvum TaxID=2972120 RepID=A0A9W9T5P2_9EURO|nr:Peptidase M54 archaemetzincin [Penicillium cf. griseofulvum]KAJ5421831.1 Peptidase M54 archaemetzincin [Penicillium cf. griseofulvum]